MSRLEGSKKNGYGLWSQTAHFQIYALLLRSYLSYYLEVT